MISENIPADLGITERKHQDNAWIKQQYFEI